MRGAFLEDTELAGGRGARRRGTVVVVPVGAAARARTTPPAQDRLPGRPGARAACRGGAPVLVAPVVLVRLLPAFDRYGEPAPPGGDFMALRDGCPDGLCRPRGARLAIINTGVSTEAPSDRSAGLATRSTACRSRSPNLASWASRPAAAPPEARRPCGRARNLARPRDQAGRRADGTGGARLRPCAGRARDRSSTSRSSSM